MTTTTSKTIIPTPELPYRTTPTASTGTRTLLHKTIPAESTASIQHTYFPTLLHRMKTEETQVFIKTLRTNIYYQYTDNSHKLLSNTAFKPSHFMSKQVKNFAFLVITGPSPPHITILYNLRFAIPFFA